MLSPLALYIHIPWCVRKCPYCDFNSHARSGVLPEDEYVNALLRDLDFELASSPVSRPPLTTIFFGGGTPSLFSAEAIARILDGVRARFDCAPDIEITLEANPGTVEQARFTGYRAAGVNRLSIGIQSLDDAQLTRLGRIHGAAEAHAAVAAAGAAGFDNFNLDMMYALPEQTLAGARTDLMQLIALEPSHISYYQLTLEPGTPFHHQPPPLPDDELAWEMQLQGQALLAEHGYAQYEVSAYAQSGRQCRHNLNYWNFGDYLGIGAGAHGKLTDVHGGARRSEKLKFPQAYTQAAGGPRQCARNGLVPVEDLPFEYLLNALRLNAGFDLDHYRLRTGSTLARLTPAFSKGLLERSGRQVRCTDLGQRHLNALLRDLLPGKPTPPRPPLLAPAAVNH
ncbi:MAG: radical SAM family heme chaperone HemW [Nevskiales bacterium]